MSRDVSPVPFPATMAFVHIITKACIAAICFYIIMKPSFAAHKDAMTSPVPLHDVQPGDQVGGWGLPPIALKKHTEGRAEAGGGGGGRDEGESGKFAFLHWAARHFGVSRDMFMRMGAPAGAALAADIWLSGIALRHVPMGV